MTNTKRMTKRQYRKFNSETVAPAHVKLMTKGDNA